MEEEIKQEETKEVKKEEDMIAQANEAASRLESANARLSQLLDRQERIAVKNMLGGTSNAGTPSKSQEEKDTEEAKKWLEGTGFENVI